MTEQVTKDANIEEGSSPALDATKTESSAVATTDAKQQPSTLEAAVDELLTERKKTEEPQTEPSTDAKGPKAADAAEGNVQKLNQTEEPAAKLPPVPGDEFKDLPFHKHERFQQLVKERNELKAATEKVKDPLDRITAIDNYCNEHRINGDQFRQALEIVALLNNDPKKAWEKLQPTLQQLQQYVGQGDISLPPDLQQAVEAGTLDVNYARRIVAAERQREFVAQRSQQTQMQDRNTATYNAVAGWEEQIKRTDPDFVRKFPMVSSRFSVLAADHAQRSGQPVLSPQIAVQLANQAYAEINDALQGFIPKPQMTKVITTNGGSSARQTNEPKTWDDLTNQLVSQFSR